MAIHRAPRPERHYLTVRNDVIRDDRLSFKAVGILVTILSHADHWQTSAEALQRKGQEGRDAVRSGLTELEDAGYLVRRRVQDERGRFSTQSWVYDEPQRVGDGSVQEDLFAQVTPTTGYPASADRPSVTRPSVDQASLEQPSRTTTGPTDQREPDPANLCATAAYEAMGKMGNFMALRQVAAKALRNGHDQPSVRAAMLRIIEAGKPVTGQTLWNALRGSQGGTIATHDDHWSNGGQFGGGETHG